MKRSDFIKKLLLSLGAASLPSVLQAMVHQYQRIYLLQSFVRGFAYYDGKKLLRQMKQGAILQLLREADNEYDNFAIALYFQDKKIGFIPAENNAILAKLMDANLLELQAEITHLQINASSWENVEIAIYVLRKSNEALPKNAKYLLNLNKPFYRSVNSETHFITFDEELFKTNTLNKFFQKIL